MKIIDYQITKAYNPGDLARNVCDMIKRGWQPYGAATESIYPPHGGSAWFQTMVKEADEKPSGMARAFFDQPPLKVGDVVKRGYSNYTVVAVEKIPKGELAGEGGGERVVLEGNK